MESWRASETVATKLKTNFHHWWNLYFVSYIIASQRIVVSYRVRCVRTVKKIIIQHWLINLIVNFFRANDKYVYVLDK